MIHLANIVAVARREYLVRVRTRSFLLGTAVLVVGVIAISMVPLVVSYFNRTGAQHIAVWSSATDLPADPAVTLSAMLNATPGGSTAEGKSTYVVSSATDLAAARVAVDKGDQVGVVGIERRPAGELHFTYYTNEPATSRTAQLIGQAASAVAIADRLARLGVAPANQASLFSPADYSVAWADPARAEPTTTGKDQGASYLLGFGLTILIFMMIILYGQWVAMSVVEEKTSRVMEVILNAATPFQLLAGKVTGVGAVALTQYLTIIVAGIVGLVLQGPLASRLLGSDTLAAALPAGLTPGMLGLLCVYGVLGFLLYAVVYAAAASLVSRQEDVQQAIMPMVLVSTAGYLVAVYSSTGLLDIRSDWLAVLAQVPFFSPFIMLSRVSAGQATALEVILSIVLLVIGIVAALWLAARVYAAGVLLYGQRPGIRALVRLVRTGM